MSFWAYVLRCRDGHYYVGHTDSLDRRIAERQHGGFCDYTSRRRPGTLVWSEQFQTRDEARTVELMLKGWTRAKKEALIQGDWATVSWLAKPPHERPSTSLRTGGD